jgi:hypothetical protein
MHKAGAGEVRNAARRTRQSVLNDSRSDKVDARREAPHSLHNVRKSSNSSGSSEDKTNSDRPRNVNSVGSRNVEGSKSEMNNNDGKASSVSRSSDAKLRNGRNSSDVTSNDDPRFNDANHNKEPTNNAARSRDASTINSGRRSRESNSNAELRISVAKNNSVRKTSDDNSRAATGIAIAMAEIEVTGIATATMILVDDSGNRTNNAGAIVIEMSGNAVRTSPRNVNDCLSNSDA